MDNGPEPEVGEGEVSVHPAGTKTKSTDITVKMSLDLLPNIVLSLVKILINFLHRVVASGV
jgi:hypothetical protein